MLMIKISDMAKEKSDSLRSKMPWSTRHNVDKIAARRHLIQKMHTLATLAGVRALHVKDEDVVGIGAR